MDIKISEPLIIIFSFKILFLSNIFFIKFVMLPWILKFSFIFFVLFFHKYHLIIEMHFYLSYILLINNYFVQNIFNLIKNN
jgi:hypothetical protein